LKTRRRKVLIKLTTGRTRELSAEQLVNLETVKCIGPSENGVEQTTVLFSDGRTQVYREPFDVVLSALGKSVITTGWVEPEPEPEETEEVEEPETKE